MKILARLRFLSFLSKILQFFCPLKDQLQNDQFTNFELRMVYKNFKCKDSECKNYRVFHGFGQAKFPSGSLVLGLSQFSILPQLPSKIMLDSKVVKIKIDPKI